VRRLTGLRRLVKDLGLIREELAALIAKSRAEDLLEFEIKNLLGPGPGGCQGHNGSNGGGYERPETVH
jgi:hypothetical protein